nr:phospholipid scramblase 2-like [Dermacentor andersoni]
MAPGPATRRATPGAAPAHPAAGGRSQTRTPIVAPPTAGVATQQATRVQMPAIPGCPAGLEYLTEIDRLIVVQSVELLNTLFPDRVGSRYVVTNTMNQFVFSVVEDFNCFRRTLGHLRPFQMAVRDFRNAEVLRLDRPLRCDSCLCFCCLQDRIYFEGGVGGTCLRCAWYLASRPR